MCVVSLRWRQNAAAATAEDCCRSLWRTSADCWGEIHFSHQWHQDTCLRPPGDCGCPTGYRWPPTTGSASMSVNTTPLPSPQTVAAAPRMRLSVFNPGNRQSWTFPEFRDNEDTVLICDSNGRSLALHKPPNWRVASYRVARLEDVGHLLRRHSLPDTIKNVVIAVGINNNNNMECAIVNHVTALRDVLAVQTWSIRVLEVPYFTDEPTQQLWITWTLWCFQLLVKYIFCYCYSRVSRLHWPHRRLHHSCWWHHSCRVHHSASCCSCVLCYTLCV